MAKPALDQALRLLYLLTVHLAPIPVDAAEIYLRSIGPTGALVRLTDGAPPAILDAARATGAAPRQLAVLRSLMSSVDTNRRALTAGLDGQLSLCAAVEQPRDLLGLCRDVGYAEAGSTLAEAARVGGWQLCALGVESTRNMPRPHRVRIYARCDGDLPQRLTASARALSTGIQIDPEILRLARRAEPSMINLRLSHGRPSVKVEIPGVSLAEVATLRLDPAEQRWLRRLTATGQRLGADTRLTSLGVRWSVGRREFYGSLPAGGTPGQPPGTSGTAGPRR